MPDKKSSLTLKNLNKESVYTASEVSASPCISSQSSQKDGSMSLKSDKKRPNPWQDNGVSKRFSGLEGGDIKMSVKHVTKPKTQYKIVPCQVNLQRLNTSGLITGASKSVNESLILFANGKLSPKVRSRLEEAINHILKDMKDQITANFKEIPISQAKNMQRLIKQIIHERIKHLMLDKHVGPHMEIVDSYRAQFPKETVQNMLKALHETLQSNSKYIQADSAEEFFEVNLENILQRKLNEMFGKLEEIYSGSRGLLNKMDLRTNNETKNEKNSPTIENDKYNNSEMTTLYLEEHDNVLQNLLRKMIPYLTQIMNLDYKHESQVADIILKTDSLRAPALGKESEHDASNQVDTVPENNKENAEDKKNASTPNEKPSTMYYVKVIGRPTLPMKDAMQTFLDQFNPKCVKKLKKQHNLLFVGFAEKKNFNDILAKSSVSIGKCLIEIKASEATRNKPAVNLINNKVNKTDISQCKNTKMVSDTKIVSSEVNNTEVFEISNRNLGSECKVISPDSVNINDTSQNSKEITENIVQFNDTNVVSDFKLSPELDLQISDLLTCIGQGEEEIGTVDANKTTDDYNSENANKNEIIKVGKKEEDSQCIAEKTIGHMDS